MPKRRTHPPEFKARVALDALCSEKTLAELAASYELHPVQVCQWKQQALKRLPDLFRQGNHGDQDQAVDGLSQQLERLERANADLMNEVQWLKKILQLRSADLALTPGARSSTYLFTTSV